MYLHSFSSRAVLCNRWYYLFPEHSTTPEETTPIVTLHPFHQQPLATTKHLLVFSACTSCSCFTCIDLRFAQPLCNLSHSTMFSGFTQVATRSAPHSSSQLNTALSCPTFYTCLSWWPFALFPLQGYYKQCCLKARPAERDSTGSFQMSAEECPALGICCHSVFQESRGTFQCPCFPKHLLL